MCFAPISEPDYSFVSQSAQRDDIRRGNITATRNSRRMRLRYSTNNQHQVETGHAPGDALLRLWQSADFLTTT